VEKNQMISEQIEKLEELKSLLDFEDNRPFMVAEKIINKLDTDVKISRTGDNEILIFREHEKCFYNILVDEDSDISFMFIGDKREESNTYMTDDDSDESIERVINSFYKNR
jgi:hypothetical protein